MASFHSFLSQAFPGKPKFTAKDIPDLSGKVCIVTGANTGIGKELSQMLYSKHAKVYVAARSQEKALKAIKEIKENVSKSAGELVFVRLDLADLYTIKTSAEEFISKEGKLNILFNDAGVMAPPQGFKTAQGYKLQLGTNNIGAFMFTKLLTPLLVKTAKAEPPATVRVIWVSSTSAEGWSPSPGGIVMDNLNYHEDKDWRYNISLNPGNLNLELYRNLPPFLGFIIKAVMLHPVKFGAYIELFAAFSPEITINHIGSWVVPWGRLTKIQKDLAQASKTTAEGGTGLAEKFWEWNEEQIKPYL